MRQEVNQQFVCQYKIRNLHFLLNSPNVLYFEILDIDQSDLKNIQVKLNHQILKLNLNKAKNENAWSFTAECPENDFKKKSCLEINILKKEKTTWLLRFTDWDLTNTSGIVYSLDSVKKEDAELSINGWCIGMSQPEIQCFSKKEGLTWHVNFFQRKDISHLFPETKAEICAGFHLVLQGDQIGSFLPINVTISADQEKKEIILDRRTIFKLLLQNKESKLHLPYRAYKTLRDEGFGNMIAKTEKTLKKSKNSYASWIKRNEPTEHELQEQRSERFSFQPLISIVVPMYHTKPVFLKALIKSIENQTYSNWELCLADAGKGDKNESPNTSYVLSVIKKDERIKYKLLSENKSIAENTNEAILMTSGKYIAFSDHDDLLAPNALFEVVKVLNEDDKIDAFYSDQDMIDWNGKKRFNPMMKPDYNEAMFCSTNYTTHLSVFSKALLDKAGYLDPQYDGSQDYDLEFRCYEKAHRIYHIPKVLYHWRNHLNSTAGDPETKHYAFENGRKAIEAHYQRTGIPATVEMTDYYGIYRTRFHWNNQPLVSILIPTKDHVEDLDRCIQSILKKTDYPDYEIILIENNSEEQKTFDYYKKISTNPKIHVITYEGAFNYSKINNFGAKAAKGDYFLLLNNDTEVINGNWMTEMMGYCQCSDVGVVGAKLLYADDTVQHAGAIIGLGGAAAHAFAGQPSDNYGYMGRMLYAQDYSAVTGACLLTKKSVYDLVNGMSEDFPVAYNDMDYCLKVRQKNIRVVYTPYAVLHHYESKSRGYEDTPEKQARLSREIAKLTEKWADFFAKGDPAYSPNLTLSNGNFDLKMASEK